MYTVYKINCHQTCMPVPKHDPFFGCIDVEFLSGVSSIWNWSYRLLRGGNFHYKCFSEMSNTWFINLLTFLCKMMRVQSSRNCLKVLKHLWNPSKREQRIIPHPSRITGQIQPQNEVKSTQNILATRPPNVPSKSLCSAWRPIMWMSWCCLAEDLAVLGVAWNGRAKWRMMMNDDRGTAVQNNVTANWLPHEWPKRKAFRRILMNQLIIYPPKRLQFFF